MKTIQIAPEEMGKQIARFREIKPQGTKWAEEMGIPLGAYKKMTAEEFYLLMSAPDLGGPFASDPAVSYEQNMIVAIVKCSPGQGPYLHAHYNTFENFMVLTGQFEILWGDEGEHRTVLDPYDMIAVPPRVVRRFQNVSDQTAHLLVFITGDSEEAFNDIDHPQVEADRLANQFGPDILDKLRGIGVSFEAGVADARDAAE